MTFKNINDLVNETVNTINQALVHLPKLLFKVNLKFENIGDGCFNDTKIGAVTNRELHSIIINLNWAMATSNQDFHYIIWHETRHLYQWSEVEKYLDHKTTNEKADTVIKWLMEFNKYIPNTPSTETKHMNQDIEIDAYSFSTYMLFLYFAEPDGSINIGLPPMTANQIMENASYAFQKSRQKYYRQ